MALLGATLAGMGCHREQPAPGSAVPLPTLSVSLAEARRKPLLQGDQVVGTVRSKVRSVVEAKATGRIISLPVTLGQKVAAGTVLARLDVGEIAARLDQAKAAREQAQTELRRATTLLQERTSTQAEFEAAQARFRVAEATVREAETLLGYAEVTAPFDGVIARKTAEVGDLAAPGKPLIELEDPSQLRFIADVPETLTGRIQPGAQYEIEIPAAHLRLTGIVAELAPAADSLSRTFRVELDLPAGTTSRTGFFGRLNIPRPETGVLIPKSSVVRRGQLDLVFVAENNRAEIRLIRTGGTHGDEIEVVSGLSPGEKLVALDADRLRDGQPITIAP